MLRRFIFCFLLINCLILINGKCIRKDILSISSGTSFGRCVGYCRRSINIKSSPKYELITLKEPNYIQTDYPSVEKQYSFSIDQWKQLISLVDPKSFQQLDETIGCPDCADGGAEWIEIQWFNKTKRVHFEKGQLIKGFEDFINQLRNLRDQYVNNI
ncbi:hypothetical protein I4U23_005763 [Adineta vaga]|nr:hypothetical protein I4U23_005763 [Adineta vaga]